MKRGRGEGVKGGMVGIVGSTRALQVRSLVPKIVERSEAKRGRGEEGKE